VRVTGIENAPNGVTDPRDYRRGMLFGSILVVVGVLMGILSLVLSLQPYHERGRVAVLSLISGLVFSGMLILTGLLLVGKGRLGLWVMYFLSALFIYSFCAGTVRGVASHTADDVYGIIMGGILLFFWLSLAGYFHNRRKLFTGWWGSKNEA
jgi:Ca2+/Na+ antiporter